MTSVVIAAHNEATVIGRCLDALLADGIDITVVANGCTDATAEVARRPGVRVLELPVGGKAGALNAGDAVAVGYPRVYLDADIMLTAEAVRVLAGTVCGGDGVLAAVPTRRLDTTGRPILVRAYFAINSRLPAFRDGLFGRGAIALSEEARSRFDHFPDMVADDLFLDSLFTSTEKGEVASVTTTVETPWRTGDLVNRLVRVRRGNAAMRLAGSTGEVAADVRDASRMSWLQDVVVPRPWLAPAGAVYAALTVVAALRARRGSVTSTSWGRDESTRRIESTEASHE